MSQTQITQAFKKKNELEPSQIRVLIGGISSAQTPIQFTVSLIRTMRYYQSSNINVDIVFKLHADKNYAKNSIIGTFMTGRYTHLLLISEDYAWNPNIIENLIHADENVIIAPIPMPTVSWNNLKLYTNVMDEIKNEDLSSLATDFPIVLNEQSQINADSKNIVYVENAPMDFVLIKKEAIMKLQEFHKSSMRDHNGAIIYNLFENLINDNGLYISGDEVFCHKYKQIGKIAMHSGVVVARQCSDYITGSIAVKASILNYFTSRETNKSAHPSSQFSKSTQVEEVDKEESDSEKISSVESLETPADDKPADITLKKTPTKTSKKLTPVSTAQKKSTKK